MKRANERLLRGLLASCLPLISFNVSMKKNIIHPTTEIAKTEKIVFFGRFMLLNLETGSVFHDARPTGQRLAGLPKEKCNHIFRSSRANRGECMTPTTFYSFPVFAI